MSSKLVQFSGVLLQKIFDISGICDMFNYVTDIDNAFGVQLDAIGEKVGQPRKVSFEPTGGISPLLDDGTYRTLLKARIAQNQWDGKLPSLYAIWQVLFPGGKIVVADSQLMSATISLSGTFDSITQQLMNNGYIVPRPQGVNYTYNYGDTPYFGFDYNNSFISGFDTGNII